MITPTSLLQRIVAKARRQHFTTVAVWLPSEQDEWDEIQMEVATETAMLAAIDIIRWQADAWNDLISAVQKVGVEVEVNEEAHQELDEMMGRLRAAISVAQDVLGIDENYLKGINNER